MFTHQTQKYVCSSITTYIPYHKLICIANTYSFVYFCFHILWVQFRVCMCMSVIARIILSFFKIIIYVIKYTISIHIYIYVYSLCTPFVVNRTSFLHISYTCIYIYIYTYTNMCGSVYIYVCTPLYIALHNKNQSSLTGIANIFVTFCITHRFWFWFCITHRFKIQDQNLYDHLTVSMKSAFLLVT